MTYVGADVESLRSAAAQLRTVADELDGHSQALTSMLGGIDWAGDVATRFLSGWTGGHRINLTSTSQFFRAAAETLERNAGEQQQASAEGSAGWGLGAGPFSSVRLPAALVGLGVGNWLSRIGSPGHGWGGLRNLSLETASGVFEGFAGSVRTGGEAWKSGFGWVWNENTGQGVRAAFAHKLAPVFSVASGVMVGLAAYEGGLVERARLKLDPTLDRSEASARIAGAAVTRGATQALIAKGSVVAGAATAAKVGGAIGVAGGPVGVVAGAAAGAVVGYAATQLLEVHVGGDSIAGHIGTAGAEIADATVDAHRARLEFVGDAMESGGDAIGEAAAAASDLKEKVWPF
jgi:hypothetical protein